ncbi:hypothetical protein Tco_1408507 [Tanacetum coccineum]
MTETKTGLTLMKQVGLQNLHWQASIGAYVNEETLSSRMTAEKENEEAKPWQYDLLYRDNHAHNGTITMKDVKAMNPQQLIEEYEYICRRLEKDRSATETHPADILDSAGDRIYDSAGSPAVRLDFPPFARFLLLDPSLTSLPLQLDLHHPIDEEEQIGMSRVVADPDSDDEVLAEIIFRGKSISGDGVVFVDKLPDDEIVDPQVKVETVFESASSPHRSRRKHLGVRSDNFLWDKPVEDFFSSESESDDDIENYIPPLPYGAFKDWEIVRCPLGNNYYQENRQRKYFTYLKELLPHVYREDLLLLRRRMNRYFRLNPDVDVGLELWRNVNMLCQSLRYDDVEDFWRTQDEWIVCRWKLYPKSFVYVLDLTNGKTAHSSTLVLSAGVYAGNIIHVRSRLALRQAYECIASAPISPMLTAKKKSGSPFKWLLVVTQNPLNGCSMDTKKLGVFISNVSCWMKRWLVQKGTALGKDFLKSVDGCQSEQTATDEFHAVSIDDAFWMVLSTVSAACIGLLYVMLICWYL